MTGFTHRVLVKASVGFLVYFVLCGWCADKSSHPRSSAARFGGLVSESPKQRGKDFVSGFHSATDETPPSLT